ncbi:hypothetical protein HN937_24565 [Candidatus Poribacteria bacterium]|nr:hypothetical protein [Candidatus Poribacteria bacterium]
MSTIKRHAADQAAGREVVAHAPHIIKTAHGFACQRCGAEYVRLDATSARDQAAEVGAFTGEHLKCTGALGGERSHWAEAAEIRARCDHLIESPAFVQCARCGARTGAYYGITHPTQALHWHRKHETCGGSL